MDATDAKILALLQENARISASQIGRLINMTQPAVGERIRKLEEKGIITGYQAILNPERLGKNITAFLLIETNDCKKLVQFCEQSNEVVETYQLSGKYNYLIKVMTTSMRTLDAFIRACSPYGFSTTMTVISAPTNLKPMQMEID